MMVAGLGCRRGAAAASIEAAIAAALCGAGRPQAALSYLVTSMAKAAEPGLHAAARNLALELRIVDAQMLAAAAPNCLTHSPRVLSLTGVPSLAEAAALAGAGPGARLLGPRLAAAGEATCALAESAP